jgi:nucleotide-binding universal stress UspA family protein
MKILLPIQYYDLNKQGISYITKFNFPDLSIRLIHVLQRLTPPLGMNEFSGYWDEEFMKKQEEEFKKELDLAEDALASHGYTTEKKLISGFTNAALLEESESYGSDLIVLSCSGKSSLTSFMSGSVSRALIASAKQSVLIARKELDQNNQKKLNILIATDFSTFFETSLQRFLHLKPQNFGNVHIVTILQSRLIEAPSIKDRTGIDLEKLYKEKLEEKLEATRKLCIDSAETVTVEIKEEDPILNVNNQISSCMQERKADLLIVAAKGHGFFERLVIGSVSFQQAVGEKYSVLVLR